jgi:hypothetical protein
MQKFEIPINEGKQLSVYLRPGPFDEAVAGLESEGLELITAGEFARLRMLSGPTSPISQEWGWVAESYNYFPNGDILIASREHNPILRNPREATEAQKRRSQFYLDDKAIEELQDRATEDPDEAIKTGVFRLSRKGFYSGSVFIDGAKSWKEIPFEALAEEPATRFLFRDNARSYSDFLVSFGYVPNPHASFVQEDGPITTMSHYVVHPDIAASRDRPFSRQLWIGSIGLRFARLGLMSGYRNYRSLLGGDDRGGLDWDQSNVFAYSEVSTREEAA